MIIGPLPMIKTCLMLLSLGIADKIVQSYSIAKVEIRIVINDC